MSDIKKSWFLWTECYCVLGGKVGGLFNPNSYQLRCYTNETIQVDQIKIDVNIAVVSSTFNHHSYSYNNIKYTM